MVKNTPFKNQKAQTGNIVNCEGGVAWKWVLSHILGDSDTAGVPDSFERLSRYVSSD